jgi:MFS transporter, ACS family, tartrate transporter
VATPLSLEGALGLAGWQWRFLSETVPSLILLSASLSPRQSAIPLVGACLEDRGGTLEAERADRRAKYEHSVLGALTNPRVLALSLCYFGVEIGLYGVILWVPQIFKHLHHSRPLQHGADGRCAQ